MFCITAFSKGDFACIVPCCHKISGAFVCDPCKVHPENAMFEGRCPGSFGKRLSSTGLRGEGSEGKGESRLPTHGGVFLCEISRRLAQQTGLGCRASLQSIAAPQLEGAG